MAIRIDKAIFLHIPKTGGTWVTNYFRETGMIQEEIEILRESDVTPGYKGMVYMAHIAADQLPSTNDLIFCFVRHPLTWYRSYWESKQMIPDRSGGYIDEIVDLSFHEFIETIIKTRPGFLTEFYNSYTTGSHLIGKQETLRDDFNNILTLLRVPYNKEPLFERPDENVVPSEQRYTTWQVGEIMRMEKSIINQYGYNYIPSGVV